MIEPDLPEGITFNDKHNDHEENMSIDATHEVINTSKCPKCDSCFQAVLINNNGRHEGILMMANSEKPFWHNNLPKDRVRSIKLLNEKLIERINTHNERHK